MPCDARCSASRSAVHASSRDTEGVATSRSSSATASVCNCFSSFIRAESLCARLQQSVGSFDNHALHPTLDGAKRTVDLGQHSRADRPFGTQCGEGVGGDLGDDTPVVGHVAQHAGFSKQKTSCVGAMREAATATADATLSAFVLSSVPRPSQVMAQNTGVSPASKSERSRPTFTPSSAISPT